MGALRAGALGMVLGGIVLALRVGSLLVGALGMVLGGIVLALRVGSLLVGALREEAGAIPGARFEDNVIGKGWPGARRNGALAPKGA